DPPYGIGFAGRPTKWQRAAGMQAREWDAQAGEVGAWLELAEVVAIWGGNYYPLPLSRGWLAWFKPDAPPSMGTVEICWTNFDQPARHIVHSISATNGERVGHPTQKPLAVMTWTLQQISAHGLVLDPFMGSGTTGVAALAAGLPFVGVEIDPDYFELACKRI